MMITVLQQSICVSIQLLTDTCHTASRRRSDIFGYHPETQSHCVQGVIKRVCAEQREKIIHMFHNIIIK